MSAATQTPAALRERTQWVHFHLESRPGDKKRRKVPCYIDGGRRVGKQGSAADRRRLATFDAAVCGAPAEGKGGIGFAFLPGDGLVGIDLDAVIDPDTGEISERARKIIAACNSYTEISPSGHGVHIYCSGETSSFKSNTAGVEVFCGSQFFTFTGRHYAGTPLEVRPIDKKTLMRLRATVNRTRTPAKTSRPGAPREASDELRRVQAALDTVNADEYQTWINVAHALKHSFGDAAYTTWDRWSARSAKYPGADETRRRWGGLQPRGDVTLGTVYALAKAAGWLAPSAQGARSRSVAPPPDGANEAGDAVKGRPVEQLLERFTLIYGTDTAWDSQEKMIVRVAHVRLAMGTKPVKRWLAHPERKMVTLDQVIFDPRAKADRADQINLFRGFALEPKPGPCVQLLRVLQFLCGEDGQDQAPVTDWVLRWIAYPLQNVGAKMQTAIVMHGAEGTGKNLFWGAVREIYGRHGGIISQMQLQSQFNPWLSAKMFLIANEVVTRQELRHHVGYLKNIITEPEIVINRKMQDERTEANFANLVFLSNELHPLQISPDDRRYMVIRTSGAMLEGFYSDVAAEITAGGAAALYHYLLHEVDLSGFSEHAKPIETEAKRELIELGMSSAQLFQRQLHDGLLDAPYVPCLSDDLYALYSVWSATTGERTPLRLNRFSAEFRAMNGVSRRVARVPDPALPAQRLLPVNKLKQRTVFVMGARPEDLDESTWIRTSLADFRSALEDYRVAQGQVVKGGAGYGGGRVKGGGT